MPSWDHLRVCGADTSAACSACTCRGSPPRVRSRRLGACGRVDVVGITSACAEQTISLLLVRLDAGDHLRVCGADGNCWPHTRAHWGSPPRVRSRLWSSRSRCRRCGITSACAEQTSKPSRRASRRRDHLRVCGADMRLVYKLFIGLGSPPRVRSRPETPSL